MKSRVHAPTKQSNRLDSTPSTSSEATKIPPLDPPIGATITAARSNPSIQLPSMAGQSQDHGTTTGIQASSAAGAALISQFFPSSKLLLDSGFSGNALAALVELATQVIANDPPLVQLIQECIDGGTLEPLRNKGSV
ncbi:hypothetical protein BDZ94DRAFT_1278695 [Collybia nuda]|uniref:Uncharacterized protein n=1 Tax=Collybia nuda TaxID=64659 RepID=A0A9P5XP92_9AGAR|nr:hypothetical protein BDZ94DRAFT_1278695 [Collybia nuda]